MQNLTTPALTSASAATSDENSLYSPSVPPWNAIPPQIVLPTPKPVIVVPPPTLDVTYTRAPFDDSYAPSSYAPSSLRSNQPRKLRKARKDDGYDSDGGYLSDSSKKKNKGKDRKNADSSSHEADFLSDGGYATKKTSDKKKDKKGDKVADGYVTDSSTRKSQHKLTKKSRPHVDDADLSDGGYLSEVSVKKKKTFFGLGSRSPSNSRKGRVSSESLPPPVPALPPPPLPIADRFARSPASFDQYDGLSSSAHIRAAYSPVTPSVDESVTPHSSIFRNAWSPPPPSDSVRTVTRPPSADLSAENLTSSSHEVSSSSHVSPPMQSWEGAPNDPPRARSREAESRALSPGSSNEQLFAAAAPPRPYVVLFTPSTRFSPSEGTFPIPPSPSEFSVASEKRPRRPKILLPNFNSNQPSTYASPRPSILRNAPPMSASSSDSRPFLSPVNCSCAAPSPVAPFLRGPSPSLSEFSIMSPSDFLVPSPCPRFFDELSPPSLPPMGPLPEVLSYGLYSHQIPPSSTGMRRPSQHVVSCLRKRRRGLSRVPGARGGRRSSRVSPTRKEQSHVQ